jgi:transposase
VNVHRYLALSDESAACIPPKASRKVQLPCDRVLCRRLHPIKNMFVRLKDRRRIHTRYDPCAHIFMAAIYSAATGLNR